MQLHSIQALRGVAATLVMFSHLYGVEARYSESEQILSSSWLLGVSGVDLFFVISGFIMVWVAHDTAPSGRAAAEFLVARILRIYPVWWLFAGLMALYLIWSYGVPWDQDTLDALGVNGPEHLVKSFLLIPHDAFPVLQIGWTLMHEVYFYVVFAALLLLPNSLRLFAYGLWAAIIIASAFAGLTGFYADSLIALALSPLTLEFLMGVTVGLLVKNGASRFAGLALVFGLIWLVVATQLVSFASTAPSLPTQRSLAYGPAFALIIYAVVVLEERYKGLRNRIPKFLVRIGDWSYSLYLGHLLAISAVARIFFPTFGAPGLIDNAIFLTLSITLALAIAAVTYHLFERPLSRYTRVLRRRIDRRSKPA